MLRLERKTHVYTNVTRSIAETVDANRPEQGASIVRPGNGISSPDATPARSARRATLNRPVPDETRFEPATSTGSRAAPAKEPQALEFGSDAARHVSGRKSLRRSRSWRSVSCWRRFRRCCSLRPVTAALLASQHADGHRFYRMRPGPHSALLETYRDMRVKRVGFLPHGAGSDLIATRPRTVVRFLRFSCICQCFLIAAFASSERFVGTVIRCVPDVPAPSLALIPDPRIRSTWSDDVPAGWHHHTARIVGTSLAASNAVRPALQRHCGYFCLTSNMMSWM